MSEAVVVSHAVFGYYLWMPLLAVAFAVPWVLVPRVPVPASDEGRQRVRRQTRSTFLLLAGLIAALFVVVAVELGIALIDAVVAPH